MANLELKDGLGNSKFVKMNGAGTDLDPHVPVQDVFIQDQSSPQISLFMGQVLNDAVTFRSSQAENIETLNITSVIAPVVGNFVCIKEGSFFSQLEITSVASVGGNDYDIGVSIPLDHAYTTSAFICLQNCNLNVNGSVTPVSFAFGPGGLGVGQKWDITRMIIVMTYDTSAGDDGTFGNLTRLTNGLYFRIENGTNYNLFNAKENADFATQGFDVVYSARSSPTGDYGMRARVTFSGPEKRGVVLRLDADDGDVIAAKVRDDLSALATFRVMFQGHVVADT